MLESVDIDANVSDNVAAAGVFDIGETDISGYLHPRKVGGPFTWDGEVLDLPEIKGTLAEEKSPAAIISSPSAPPALI